MTDSGHLTSTLHNEVLVVSFLKEKVSVDEMIVADVSAELFAMTDASIRVVLDMSRVDFFGSSFIEGMFRAWKRTKGEGGGFAVCCLTPYCHEVLEVTNLLDMWGGQPTCEAAVAALSET